MDWRAFLDTWRDNLSGVWLPGLLLIVFLGFMIVSIAKKELVAAIVFAVLAVGAASYLGLSGYLLPGFR
ncbi:MAG: hypothetical protein WC966_04135 [Bradymonadales bacterium]|jgi:hypothetical protein